jgi:hypothetical protein
LIDAPTSSFPANSIITNLLLPSDRSWTRLCPPQEKPHLKRIL